MSVEILTVQLLNTVQGIDGVEAFLNVPAVRPARFITVEQTGSNRVNRITDTVLAVQVWAQNRVETARLAEKLRDRLEALEHNSIATVDVTNVYNFPDPDSRQARYQLTTIVTTV